MNPILLLVIGCILTSTTFYDLRYQRIPNLLTYPSMCFGLVYYGFLNGIDGLLFSLEGLTVGLGVFLVPYLIGGMGAGDAKLMGAVGTILGPRDTFAALIFTGIAGGIYALIVCAVDRNCLNRYILLLRTTILTQDPSCLKAPDSKKAPKLCYGLAIAAGTLFTLFIRLSAFELPI